MNLLSSQNATSRVSKNDPYSVRQIRREVLSQNAELSSALKSLKIKIFTAVLFWTQKDSQEIK